MSSSDWNASSIQAQSPQAVERLSPLDFPPLYQCPPYESLLSILNALEFKPKAWDSVSSRVSSGQDDTRMISQYLTGFIKNDFSWFSNSMSEDEASAKRENLWELAGKRLAERSGRNAMPSMIRTWVIPNPDSRQEFKVEICEPPLTGDNLGLKTWGTAYVMAKNLEEIGRKYLQATLNPDSGSPRILELGAGTGLLGIAAAMLWAGSFTLTDLPQILPNLSSNVLRNKDKLVGSVEVEVLVWADLEQLEPELVRGRELFDLILISDPLYDVDHPELVAEVIAKHLKPSSPSRVLAAVPLRDETTRKMKDSFVKQLLHLGFEPIVQEEEICYDDWDDARNEDEAVKCWWSVWKPGGVGL